MRICSISLFLTMNLCPRLRYKAKQINVPLVMAASMLRGPRATFEYGTATGGFDFFNYTRRKSNGDGSSSYRYGPRVSCGF